MLLSYKGVKYVAEDLTMEEFGAKKAAGAFVGGQIPVWTENGRQMNQTGPILRYLAKKYGLHPNDNYLAW